MPFPEDRPFGIRLCGSNLVIDVSSACDDIGTSIIVWHLKSENNANQKWIYENNKLRSLKSGLILSVPQLEIYSKAEQQHDTGKKGQSYKYKNNIISTLEDDKLVLGIIGDRKDNSCVGLLPYDDKSISQKWEIIY